MKPWFNLQYELGLVVAHTRNLSTREDEKFTVILNCIAHFRPAYMRSYMHPYWEQEV